MQRSFFSFPKSTRLLKQNQFREVSRHGKQKVGKFLVVHCYSINSLLSSKLGLTVSRKYGKAHVRNRFKRVVREAFRHLRPELPKPMYLNVRPREDAIRASMEEIQNDLKALLKDS